MSDRRNEGPINGRIGYSLAIVKQLTPLFGWLGFLFIVFGFKVSPPGKQLEELTTKVALIDERSKTVENLVAALVRIRCVDVESRDAKLLGLPCEDVR